MLASHGFRSPIIAAQEEAWNSMIGGQRLLSSGRITCLQSISLAGGQVQGAAAVIHCAVSDPVERCSTNMPTAAVSTIADTVHTRLGMGRCDVGGS